MSRQFITACIPSMRGREAVATVFAVCNQTRPPDRVILRDTSPDGSGEDVLLATATRYLGVEVHRGEPGEDVVLAREGLFRAALRSPVDYCWVVDDDVWPFHDCLARLLATREEYGVPLVGGTRVDLVAMGLRNQALGWVRSEDQRNRPTFVPCCDGANFLVDPRAWLAADNSYRINPDEFAGGDDIVMSAQIALRKGAVVEPRAVGLHVRTQTPRWLSQGGHDRDRLVKNLTGRLKPAELDDFLKRVGF
jgi:hypothetical protein